MCEILDLFIYFFTIDVNVLHGPLKKCHNWEWREMVTAKLENFTHTVVK